MKNRLLPLLILLLVIPIITITSATQITVQNTTAKVNQTFTVNVSCVPTEPVKAYEMKIHYDPRILSATSLTAGDFFTGKPVFSSPNALINNTDGTITNIYALTVGEQLMVTKPGLLLSITFTALQNGTSPIRIYDAGVANDTRYLPLDTTNGTVTVNGMWYPDNSTPPDDNVTDDPPPDDPPSDDKPPIDDTPPDNNQPAQNNNNNDPDALSWLTQNLIIVLITGFIIIWIITTILGLR